MALTYCEISITDPGAVPALTKFFRRDVGRDVLGAKQARRVQ